MYKARIIFEIKETGKILATTTNDQDIRDIVTHSYMFLALKNGWHGTIKVIVFNDEGTSVVEKIPIE